MTICAVFPYNPCLLRPRSLHVIKAMLAAGHTVRVVYVAERFGQDFVDSEIAKQCNTVRKVRFAGVVPTVLRWLAGMSVSRAWCGSAEAKRVVQELSLGADVVWVEHLRGAGMLPEELHVPIVWDAVDALGHLFAGRAELVGNPVKAMVFRHEARRTQREEQALAEMFAATVAVTKREADLIGPRVIPIQNGVDFDYFQPENHPVSHSDAPNICMVGRWNYLPNAHGCAQFLRDVWPTVSHAVPGATCSIIGPGSETGTLVADAVSQGPVRESIVVTGPVTDIRPYIHQSVLTVCPAMLAAGMQNKILESLACGVPVVCTSTAAAGTIPGGTPGLIPASTHAEMAEAIINLIRNPETARCIGTDGRAALLQKMSWTPSYAKIATVLEQVLQR